MSARGTKFAVRSAARGAKVVSAEIIMWSIDAQRTDHNGGAFLHRFLRLHGRLGGTTRHVSVGSLEVTHVIYALTSALTSALAHAVAYALAPLRAWLRAPLRASLWASLARLARLSRRRFSRLSRAPPLLTTGMEGGREDIVVTCHVSS